MKIKALVLGIALLSVYACKKEKKGEETTTTETTTQPDNSNVVPDVFTKRVILEKFTGEWCGYCPGGSVEVKGYLATHGDKLIAVDLHGGDPYETSHTNYLDNASLRYDIQYYPSAIIDRKTSNSYTSSWGSKINTELATTAKLGIKLETTIDNNGLLDVVAKVVSNEVLQNAYITLYLVEDNVPQSSPNAQSDYTGDAGAGYVHQHVLRKVLATSPHGEALNITETRVEYTKEHNDIDISSYNASNLKVVAIVNEHQFVTANLKAYNAKEVKAGESTDWN